MITTDIDFEFIEGITSSMRIEVKLNNKQLYVINQNKRFTSRREVNNMICTA